MCTKYLYENLYESIKDNLTEGVFFVDKNRKITYWNEGAERITGYTEKEIIETICFKNRLNHTDDEGKPLCMGGCPLHSTILDGKKRTHNCFLNNKEGHRVKVAMKIMPIIIESEIIGAVQLFVEDREKIEMLDLTNQLRNLVICDELTGLPNRRYLEIYIKSKISEYYHSELPLGVAIIDIDYFNDINDIYGHAVGDDILKMLAKKFKGVTRRSDIIGRWGGGEFVCVFSGIDMDDLEKKADEIRMLVEKSRLYGDDEKQNHITVSIGVTTYRAGERPEDLINRADEQMYTAKIGGKNKVVIG